MSPMLILPRAPSMSPRWAASRTAAGAGVAATGKRGAGAGGAGAGGAGMPGSGTASCWTRGSVTVGTCPCVAGRAAVRGGGVFIFSVGRRLRWARRGFPAPPVIRDGGFQDVVDGDDTEDVVVRVDHRDGHQVVVGHQQRDVGRVGVRADPDRVGVQELGQPADVALLMADYNLMTIPVIDPDNH